MATHTIEGGCGCCGFSWNCGDKECDNLSQFLTLTWNIPPFGGSTNGSAFYYYDCHSEIGKCLFELNLLDEGIIEYKAYYDSPGGGTGYCSSLMFVCETEQRIDDLWYATLTLNPPFPCGWRDIRECQQDYENGYSIPTTIISEVCRLDTCYRSIQNNGTIVHYPESIPELNASCQVDSLLSQQLM